MMLNLCKYMRSIEIMLCMLSHGLNRWCVSMRIGFGVGGGGGDTINFMLNSNFTIGHGGCGSFFRRKPRWHS
jgi:hypothetical protein